jgi:glutamine amidotransferase
MKKMVAIVDYQMGNVFSVEKLIKRLGYQVEITSEKNIIKNADKLILPGVGHFGKAMDILNSDGLIDSLNEAVLIRKIPILGICLGMQLLAEKSEEGNVNGLGWIKGEIVKFNVKDKVKYKVPHTGLNTALVKKESMLMKGITVDAEFYFVHAYHFSKGNHEDTLAETNYEETFVSAVEKENIFGVQFHPEKSHDSGAQLIKNFIEL